MPLSQDAERASSARCYLTTAVRLCCNLAIVPRTLVTALRFEDDRVVGGDGLYAMVRLEQVSAREVILSAGAIHSPAMLLRAGIGPAGHLRTSASHRSGPARGRPQLAKPHVSAFRLDAPARHAPGGAAASLRDRGNAAFLRIGRLPRARSLAVHDRQGPARIRTAPIWAMVGAALYSPFARGKVTLVSPDSAMPPRIEFRMLEDSRPAPHAQGSAICRRSVARPRRRGRLPRGLPAAVGHVAAPVQSAGLGRRIAGTRCQGGLNAPAPVRRASIARLIRPGRWFASRHRRLPLSDAELLAAAAPMAHPVGTCAIGRCWRSDGCRRPLMPGLRCTQSCAWSMHRSCHASRARTPICRRSWLRIGPRS